MIEKSYAARVRRRQADGLERALSRALLASVKQYATIHARMLQRMEDARSFVEGLACSALSTEDRSRLATALYGRRSAYGPAGLFPWEEDWYRHDLPAAPAKILLGGAGAGREALVLADWGHTVVACEPALGLYRAARERLQGSARVWQLGYEDWLPAPQSGSRSKDAESLFSEAPFDAVILGWASLSHVLDDVVRRELFEQLARLCPRGPILFSFFRGGSTITSPRARRWGSVAGQLLVRRGTKRAAASSERLLPHAGFVRSLSVQEISDLALTIGRSVRFHERAGSAAHCTLLAPAAEAQAPPPKSTRVSA